MIPLLIPQVSNQVLEILDLSLDLFLSMLLASTEQRNVTSNGLGLVLLSWNFPRW